MFKNIKFLVKKLNFNACRLINPRVLINSNTTRVSFSSLNTNDYKTNNKKEEERLENEYNEFMKNPEENMKKALINIEKIIDLLQNPQSTFIKIKECNQYINNIITIPVGLPLDNVLFHNLNDTLIKSISKLVFDTYHDIILFLKFIDLTNLKLGKDIIEKVIIKEEKLLTQAKDPETISFLSQLLSKLQITTPSIWDYIISEYKNNKDEFNAGQLCKIFLGLIMISNENVEMPIVQLLLSSIEKLSKDLTYIDVFRLSMSISKKTIDPKIISQKLWNTIQNTMLFNITKFDLYQLSNILVLLCEYSHVDQNTFNKIEKEVIESYLNRLSDTLKMTKEINKQDTFDFTSLLEDFSLLCFSFALNKAGSESFWVRVFEFFLEKRVYISNNSLENIIFCCYRLQDNHYNTENIYNIVTRMLSEVQEIIIKNQLLVKNIINPFNLMMPLARINSFNIDIWEFISKNIFNVITNPKFAPNSFVLADIIYAFSTYKMYLNSQSAKENSYYELNFIKFWKHIDELLSKTELNDISSLANIMLDLVQLQEVKMEKAWSHIFKSLEILFEKNNNIDSLSYSIVCMGISRLDSKDVPDTVIKSLIKYFNSNSSNFSIDLLKKICLCFMRSIKDPVFWNKFEITLCDKITKSKDNDVINLEFLLDMQVPLAIVGIKSPIIWKKFAEISLKNGKLLEEDLEFLMNSIFAFPRCKAITYQAYWNKILSILKAKLNELEIDDLSHIAICLDEKLFLEDRTVHDLLFENKDSKIFWNRLMKNIDMKVDTITTISTCNSLLKSFNDNSILKSLSNSEYSKGSLKQRVEDRLNSLLKQKI